MNLDQLSKNANLNILETVTLKSKVARFEKIPSQLPEIVVDKIIKSGNCTNNHNC